MGVTSLVTPKSNSESNVKPMPVFGRPICSKHIEAKEQEAAASIA
ncbi:hypothetical protein [Paenibacillus turpanensis]|nr:hypothetical protein [Paenibacillus turpanensis]